MGVRGLPMRPLPSAPHSGNFPNADPGPFLTFGELSQLWGVKPTDAEGPLPGSSRGPGPCPLAPAPSRLYCKWRTLLGRLDTPLSLRLLGPGQFTFPLLQSPRGTHPTIRPPCPHTAAFPFAPADRQAGKWCLTSPSVSLAPSFRTVSYLLAICVFSLNFLFVPFTYFGYCDVLINL